jgi:hypothetical protein
VDRKHEIVRWDEGVAAIEQIADLPTRRVVRRAASLACSRIFQNPEGQTCSFDLAFFVSMLEEILRNKQIVIQELNGEECADWWESDFAP